VPFPEQLARDAVYAARTLRRSPGLTLLSAGTLGVGIGVATLLFALVHAIVLRPLPYPQPDRLVRIFDRNPEAGVDRSGVASGNVADWRRRSDAFDGLAAYYVMGRTLSSDADAEVVMTAQVSHDFFGVIGIAPGIGRTFTDDETARAAFNSAAAPVGPDPVAVLSHELWLRLGGDPEVLGRTVTLDRRPFRVVGVMPPGFSTPEPGVHL
jgi:MacB-like periplasmic core domain